MLLDGYRLAIKSEFLDTDINIEVVIPGKTLNEVSKILEDNRWYCKYNIYK